MSRDSRRKVMRLWSIQATHSPLDGIALLSVTGITRTSEPNFHEPGEVAPGSPETFSTFFTRPPCVHCICSAYSTS